MNRCAFNALKGLIVENTNGELGRICDLAIDESTWMIRHLVIEAGRRWNRRHFTAHGSALRHVDWHRESVRIDDARQAIQPLLPSQLAPDDWTIDGVYERPTTFGLYTGGIGVFPLGTGSVGGFEYPLEIPRDSLEWNSLEGEEELYGVIRPQVPMPAYPSLCFANEVNGYALRASDGFIGIVSDFVVDTVPGGWRISALVAQMGGWLSSQKVLVSPENVNWICWDDQCVSVRLTRQGVRDSPRFSEAFSTQHSTRYETHGSTHRFFSGI